MKGTSFTKSQLRNKLATAEVALIFTTDDYGKVKKKVNLSLYLTKYHAMKAYWRSRDIAPRILNVGTRWMRMVSFTSPTRYPRGRILGYSLCRRLGWAPEPVWTP